MNHPPYHLRPNKAVDRMLFLDIVEQLQSFCDVSKCTYYGLGGPFLEDFRLFNSRFQSLKAVSIERDENTHRRQKFHKSSRLMKFAHTTVDDYLTNTFVEDRQCIFWLDYTDFKLKRVHEFERLLGLVGANSIIKVTVNVGSGRRETELAAQRLSDDQAESVKDSFAETYTNRFYKYLDNAVNFNDLSHSDAPSTAQRVLRIAATLELTPTDRDFQLVHSCTYQDGEHQMLSITGVVTSEAEEVRAALSDWKFANLAWEEPERLNVPDLSVKERLVLEKCLPGTPKCIDQMERILGYSIGADASQMLQQYRDYYRLLPMFAKFGV